MTAAGRLAGLKDLPLARFRASAVRVLVNLAALQIPAVVASLAEAARASDPVGFSAARDAVSTVSPRLCYGPSAEEKGDARLESEAAALGRRLTKLFEDEAEAVTSVTIVSDIDPDDPVLSAASVIVMGKRTRRFMRPRLVDAIAEAAGEEKRRPCPRCGEEKPPAQFSRSAHNCKVCERKRVREYEAKKRAAKMVNRPAETPATTGGTDGATAA
jgi:hypothetical protein